MPQELRSPYIIRLSLDGPSGAVSGAMSELLLACPPLQELRSPYIIRLLDVFPHKHNLKLVFECMEVRSGFGACLNPGNRAGVRVHGGALGVWGLGGWAGPQGVALVLECMRVGAGLRPMGPRAGPPCRHLAVRAGLEGLGSRV